MRDAADFPLEVFSNVALENANERSGNALINVTDANICVSNNKSIVVLSCEPAYIR